MLIFIHHRQHVYLLSKVSTMVDFTFILKLFYLFLFKHTWFQSCAPDISQSLKENAFFPWLCHLEDHQLQSPDFLSCLKFPKSTTIQKPKVNIWNTRAKSTKIGFALRSEFGHVTLRARKEWIIKKSTLSLKQLAATIT